VVVVHSDAVDYKGAVVVVLKATPTASGAVMHPRQLKDLAFLAVLELEELLMGFLHLRN